MNYVETENPFAVTLGIQLGRLACVAQLRIALRGMRIDHRLQRYWLRITGTVIVREIDPEQTYTQEEEMQ